MTTTPISTTASLQPVPSQDPSACGTFVTALAKRNLLSAKTIEILCRTNGTIVLAIITFVALLIGWIGGSVTGLLPTAVVTVMAITAFMAGGYGGLTGAIEQAKEGKLDIDFLMIAAAIGAAAIGEWEEGALLLFLFTLSGGLEEFALDRTRRAIEALADLRPDTATVRRDTVETIVAVDQLRIGEVVIVHPGERLPVDGLVARGTTTIDQSPITGESVPVYKAEADQVFAGTINGSGAIDVTVSKVAAESTLSKIVQLVQDARKEVAPTQRFIDRYSQPYTYAVIGATLLAILLPQLLSAEPFATTIYRAMTLLVVASPCALIISTPASILSAIASAARSGVLFKGGAYLEKMAHITTVAFDKTGTLTRGNMVVTDLQPLGNYSQTELLQCAASAELLSEHHIAKAIVEKARELNLILENPDAFESIAGHGLQARFNRASYVETVFIGNDKLFMGKSINLSETSRTIGKTLQQQGKTAMLVVRRKGAVDDFAATDFTADSANEEQEWEALGFIAVADTVRPEAASTIAALREQGIQNIVMLTGDNQDVAKGIAAELGIDNVYSDLMPEQKVEILQQLVTDQNVVMIGDGVNDAPALATASVGVAMGIGGTDVALETADIVLMSSDLSMLPFTLELSRRADRIVRQNVLFSISVIAALIFATIILPMFLPNFSLPLPLGVVGHEGSTLLVVANGLRLLAMQPSKDEGAPLL